jgi:signal transduction histidine kinase
MSASWINQRPLSRAVTEGALVAVLAILAAVSAQLAADGDFIPLLASGLAPLLVVVWRPDAPVAVFLLVQLLAIPSRYLTGANGPAQLVVLVAIYTVASRRTIAWTAVAVAVDATSLAVVLSIRAPTGPIGVELIGQLAGSVVAALLGLYVQSRRTAEQALRERADRLDRERELNARAAVEEERRRISRELHDVVAHHVSVMTLKAGALEKQLQRTPALDPQLGETAAGIRQTGQQAMTELRRLLGLLRRDDDDGGRSPQPDLSALELLAARMRDAGMPLELTVAGAADQVGAGMSLVVYRIVQEAVTNTLRHAGPVPTTVEVTVGDAEVALRVRDHGARAATPPRYPEDQSEGGHGLVGMRERAALFAGRVEAGPHPDGGFEIVATLPRHTRR